MESKEIWYQGENVKVAYAINFGMKSVDRFVPDDEDEIEIFNVYDHSGNDIIEELSSRELEEIELKLFNKID
jgi:hypothetical protein